MAKIFIQQQQQKNKKLEQMSDRFMLGQQKNTQQLEGSFIVERGRKKRSV